jgi:hypothetical protein
MYAPEKTPADPQVAQVRDLPLAYQFYRGVELHPRFLGVGKFYYGHFFNWTVGKSQIYNAGYKGNYI